MLKYFIELSYPNYTFSQLTTNLRQINGLRGLTLGRFALGSVGFAFLTGFFLLEASYHIKIVDTSNRVN